MSRDVLELGEDLEAGGIKIPALEEVKKRKKPTAFSKLTEEEGKSLAESVEHLCLAVFPRDAIADLFRAENEKLHESIRDAAIMHIRYVFWQKIFQKSFSRPFPISTRITHVQSIIGRCAGHSRNP